MRTKHFFLMAGMLFTILFYAPQRATAQEVLTLVEEVSITDVKPGKVRYYSPSCWSNMFVSLGAGTEIFIADKEGDVRFTLALDAAIGKWITPELALRFSAMGGALENHWTYDRIQRIHYFGFYGDLMWDAFATFKGYNESRVFTIIPFAGIGYNYAFKDNLGEDTYAFPISMGAKFNFRLNRSFDIFVEARANLLGEHFNTITGGTQVESIVSGVGGISYKFGKSFIGYDIDACQQAIAVLNEKTNLLRAALIECMETECPPCPEVIVAEEVAIVNNASCKRDLTAVVRFAINSSNVSNEEMVNVYNIAQWMNSNPSCGVEIVGYADKDTGSDAYNMMLSEKRADTVVKLLCDKYGIDKKRITMKAKGSSLQPFPDNNWNRVVIFYGKADAGK